MSKLDKCFICGKNSPYKPTLHPDYRNGYVEGEGQGCFRYSGCKHHEQKKLIINMDAIPQLPNDADLGYYVRKLYLENNNQVYQGTAIDWLEDALAENLKEIITKCNFELMESLFQKARLREKEQRKADYNIGYSDAQCNHTNKAETFIN